ncbi:cytochrome P450 307a1-like [Adelges cooleyi]|uniref:cytochrome P450 307a1-like n=1 Tax=Adelges cooleyi TaxID=133065 RepID=UPI00217F4D79|nr:cytochrome P450 307a1-like [Adelges cooleyi]
MCAIFVLSISKENKSDNNERVNEVSAGRSLAHIGLPAVRGRRRVAMDTVTGVAVAFMLLLLLLVAYGRRRTRPGGGGEVEDAVDGTGHDRLLDGPAVFPVIGCLHAMDGHQDRPFRRLAELARQYGPVYSMRMGAMPCVVVNDFESIKEVLITKGAQFGGRPDFMRYNVLFGGDRNNSLALCDWSWLQETRRKIARMYCSPKVCSSNYQLLDSIASEELDVLLDSLAHACPEQAYQYHTVQMKPLLLMSCANMFVRFMCTKQFAYEDPEFRDMVRTFDEIFWDINQGYAVDFMPWLRPFYSNHMNKLTRWSTSIRQFIMKSIISERNSFVVTGDDESDEDKEPRDFTDALLFSLRKEPGLSMQHVLFELEDFIGGHSAVGNLVMLVLSMIATRPAVIESIRAEAEEVTGGSRAVRLYDKPDMPYTEATMFETLRMLSSPIVPHVATEDTSIKDFKIAKGTCIIINNHELNTSELYWENPSVFDPNRFIQRKAGAKPSVRKPEHFLPFSTGKRTCIGQQLVSGFGFVLLAGIIQKYDVKGTDQLILPEARLALPPDTYPLLLRPIKKSQ